MGRIAGQKKNKMNRKIQEWKGKIGILRAGGSNSSNNCGTSSDNNQLQIPWRGTIFVNSG